MSFALKEPRFLNRVHLNPTLSLAFVLATLTIHLVLQTGGGAWALPMVFVAVLPALSADLLSAALGVGTAVTVDLFMGPQETTSDSFINIALLIMAGILSVGARRRYQALRRSPAVPPGRLDRVLDALCGLIPIVTLDKRGSVVSMTAPASRMFGCEPNAVTGRPFSSLVDHFIPGIHQESGSVPTATGRWIARRTDGRFFHLDIASATVNQDGERLSILHLSDAVQPQDAANDSQMATEQMFRIWRLNSLGLMAATLAHELGQPLTAAANYMHAAQADMVQAGPLADNANQTLGLAKHQIIRAGQVIGKMQDLLAPNSGNRRPERVSAIVHDLDPILGPLCREANVHLRLSIDAGTDTVLADSSQIQQVIVNLVRNAVEAVSECPDRIVAISGRPLPAEVYEILIEDSGPGFVLEETVASAEPRTGGRRGLGLGLGLGLSVARSLIERQGGVLSIGRSEGLGGAAVRFTLTRAILQGSPA